MAAHDAATAPTDPGEGGGTGSGSAEAPEGSQGAIVPWPETSYDLVPMLRKYARQLGWDVDFSWRDGDGIHESAGYDVYADKIGTPEEYGR